MPLRRSARISAISPKHAEVGVKGITTSEPKTVNRRKRKITATENPKPISDGNDTPSTPKRKKTTKILPPETPMHAVAKLLSISINSGEISAPAPAVDRLVVPNGTNAPLISPESHRMVSNIPVDQVSPSKKSNITSTTKNILEDALAHLIKIEPKLKPIIEKNPCNVFSASGLAKEIDPFENLVSGIISQQVSGAAANSIKAKFVALFNSEEDPSKHAFPTPSQVSSKTIEILRSAGLSQRKAEYVQGLAQKFHNKELTTEMLFSASYEEVLEELIKVRGLGKWSIEMFACFGLKRIDVFSTGDLGVQRGMAALAGRDIAKLKSKGGKWKYMSEKEMEETAEKFKPYRSVYMWYCWRAEDVITSTLE